MPISKALHRVTAAEVSARRDQPPFAASAMDGYAVRVADVATLPVRLKIIGTSAAGHAFKPMVKAGEAVRILTGAPLPKGADAIVIQENTTRVDGMIEVRVSATPGQNVRVRGLDFRSGEKLIEVGRKLNARDVGLLAALNCASVKVRKRPVVAVLATGDELVLPGGKPRADQIVSSNSHGLLAMAQELGAEPFNGGLVRDDLAATERAIRKLAHADILVTTGGASVGDHDFVQEALKRAGVRIDFWKIAMRPGKPFMYGRKGKLHVLGLPGNPVSAMVCAELFLRPLVAAMLGQTVDSRPQIALAGAPLPANDQRMDHLRAALSWTREGQRVATPFGKQDSSMMRSYRNADCLIVRQPDAQPAALLDPVQIILL